MPGVYKDPVTGKIHPAAALIQSANQAAQAGQEYGPPSPRDMIIAGVMPGPDIPSDPNYTDEMIDPSRDYGLAPHTFPDIHSSELSMAFNPGEKAGVGVLQPDGTYAWTEPDPGMVEEHKRRRMNEIVAGQMVENPVTRAGVTSQFGALGDIIKTMVSLGLAPPVRPEEAKTAMPKAKEAMTNAAKARAAAELRKELVGAYPDLAKLEMERTAPARARQTKLSRFHDALKAKGSIPKGDLEDERLKLAMAIDPENPEGLLADYDAQIAMGETGKSFMRGKPTHGYVPTDAPAPRVAGTETPLMDSMPGLISGGAGGAPAGQPQARLQQGPVTPPQTLEEAVALIDKDPSLSDAERTMYKDRAEQRFLEKQATVEKKVDKTARLGEAVADLASSPDSKRKMISSLQQIHQEKQREAKEAEAVAEKTRLRSLETRVKKHVAHGWTHGNAGWGTPVGGGGGRSRRRGIVDAKGPYWKPILEAIAEEEKATGQEMTPEGMKEIATRLMRVVEE